MTANSLTKVRILTRGIHPKQEIPIHIEMAPVSLSYWMDNISDMPITGYNVSRLMKKSIPPFIANTPDDMHCVNAVFRMVYKHFFHKNISWEEIDALSKAMPGKATWTFVGEMEFAKLGLTVTNIEPLDYTKLHDLGEKYLYDAFGKETADYYMRQSHIASVIKYIPEYLKSVSHENRKATLQDIIQALHEGALVGAEINSRVLNNKPGFSLHYVLIYDSDGTHFTLHDPGLPPFEARKVTIEGFQKCFDYEGANASVTMFHK